MRQCQKEFKTLQVYILKDCERQQIDAVVLFFKHSYFIFSEFFLYLQKIDTNPLQKNKIIQHPPNMTMKENVFRIGKAIQTHIDNEMLNNITIRAFARALCSVDEESPKQFWLTNTESTSFHGNKLNDGQAVYKYTKFGIKLLHTTSGSFSYRSPTYPRMHWVEHKAYVYNHSTYSVNKNTAKDITINIDGDKKVYTFNQLQELLIQEEDCQQALNDALKKEQEARQKAEEARIQKEKAIQEAERQIAEENVKKYEAQLIKVEERARKLAKDLENNKLKIKTAKSFVRENYELRSQHALDRFQTKAVTAHIFDGIPFVINGGPGTGKTTTAIQRINFLITKSGLCDYTTNLTQNQIEKLTDPSTRDENWVFFSPTVKLLKFLKNNMVNEGLSASEDKNIYTTFGFRAKVIRDSYRLCGPGQLPFDTFKIRQRDINKIESVLIYDPDIVIQQFTNFVKESIKNEFDNLNTINTSNKEWRIIAAKIKSEKDKIENATDLAMIARRFFMLHEENYLETEDITKQLNSLVMSSTAKILVAIENDEKLKSCCVNFFKDINNHVYDDGEQYNEYIEEQALSFHDIELRLSNYLNRIIRLLSKEKNGDQTTYSKAQSVFLNQFQPIIEENTDFDAICDLSLFVYNFSNLCKGVEINILDKIPTLYKAYRQTIDLNDADGPFNITLMETVINRKPYNSRLHFDEQNLLIGFINELLFSIHKISPNNFKHLKHDYVDAYKNLVKHIICIDEATDYSILDFYFMKSFRHYEFHSITLLGDIMQGLTRYGIKSWEQLKGHIFPNLDVLELNISYRQTPLLVDTAREMYKDDLGQLPNYRSKNRRNQNEPKAIAFISNDEEEKAQWIAERIVEVYNTYDNQMPSVGIFVSDKENIDDFIELLYDTDLLGSIEIQNASENRTIDRKDVVGVYRLSEVKGMEFEVVLFHNIDQATNDDDSWLIRRYLYVGISRAASHLGATFKKRRGTEDITKYFELVNPKWEQHKGKKVPI